MSKRESAVSIIHPPQSGKKRSAAVAGTTIPVRCQRGKAKKSKLPTDSHEDSASNCSEKDLNRDDQSHSGDLHDNVANNKCDNMNIQYQFSIDEIELFRVNIQRWYTENRRKLPWRGDPFLDDDVKASKVDGNNSAAGGHNRMALNEVSPYGILVSELMCQQTRWR
jgi:hypothetical protein